MCARLLFTVVVLLPALGCSDTADSEGIDHPSVDGDDVLCPIGAEGCPCGFGGVCNSVLQCGEERLCEASDPDDPNGMEIRDPGDAGGEERADGGTEQQCAACAELEYTACSCAASDPCGWRNDGNCDSFCGALLPGAHFDDSADCEVDDSGGACAECATYEYSECSCSAANPCRWQEDHSCDAYCAEAFPDDHFDDSVDCR